MINLHKQTLETFGESGQIAKLEEEALELVEAIREYRAAVYHQTPERFAAFRHVLEEAADTSNVIKSLIHANPEIETIALSKMFRTQIRIHTGYYKKNEDD